MFTGQSDFGRGGCRPGGSLALRHLGGGRWRGDTGNCLVATTATNEKCAHAGKKKKQGILHDKLRN